MFRPKYGGTPIWKLSVGELILDWRFESVFNDLDGGLSFSINCRMLKRLVGNGMITKNHDNNLFAELVAAQEAGQAVAMATIIRARGSVPRHAGSKMLIYQDGRVSGTIGGGEMEARVIDEAQQAIGTGQPRLAPYSLVNPANGDPGVCGGEVEVYIEPFNSPATVLVLGAGHVGRAVVQLAGWLGFRVALHDDREEMVSPKAVPGADIYLAGDFEAALAQFQVTENTYIVIVTRNVTLDRQIIPRLLDTPAPYIGVIGSRRRWAETLKLLTEDGYSEESLKRCHSPIGLELNAETPAEIAVSIMAEIIMQRRDGSGRQMAKAAGSGHKVAAEGT